MNKWGVVLAVGLLGSCASGEEAIYLTNSSSQQVKCGPFATKTPVKRYLEAQYGAPGSAERLGDTASTQLQDCVEEYQKQGYALLGAPSSSAPPLAPVARDLAKPIYEAALATEQGDAARALRIMRGLAGQGDTRAQTVLGKAYKDGLGVPQDYVQAHMWYNLAAASAGSSSAERELRDIAFNEREVIAQLMSREQIAEAQKLAREWKPSRAN